MKKIAILLADGFEEVEALTPKDVFSRAGFICDLVSIKENNVVRSTHEVCVLADKVFSQCGNFSEYDMIVLPGGMPGAKFLAESEKVLNIVRDFDNQGKYIGAICAAPSLVLSRAGIGVGRKVTSYPGMDGYLSDSVYMEDAVVQDNNLITSRGPATAFEFAFKLVDVLGGNSSEISNGMLYSYYR
ncbi:MAG: DJ-1/PfpI family protein [Clostridia bacterium]|nr:DJ-1/PfpI family protein [Clostridia bacterium]